MQYTFNNWVKRKIAPPLLVVGLLLLFSQIVALGIYFYSTSHQKSKFLDRLAVVGMEAISYNQPRLLDHMAAIATNEVGVHAMALCNSPHKVAWSYPYSMMSCHIQESGMYNLLQRSLFPGSQYPLILMSVPKWPPIHVLFGLFIMCLFIVFGGVFLLWRIRYRIRNDIYIPVTQLSHSRFQSQILELHQVNDNLNLLRDNEKKQAALVAIGSVASAVAHDIRSPLSSMQAALMMLRKQCGGNKDAKDYLDLLQLSSTRLEGISNGLLAKYKGEESGSHTFSIHEVLDELIGELRASPIGQGTAFVKHYHSNALYVSGDKTGVSRAIGNVIKNALEAMQKDFTDKRKQLTVSTKFCQPQDGNICICIADTGPGIPADKIPLILQGGHTEGKADGHGIGTKVVKEMVEAHKGQLSIESQVGIGTSFVISLPATIQNDETVITISHVASATVCVIDDEPSLREQWRLELKAQSVDALIFSSWEEIDLMKKVIAPESTFIVDYHFDNSEVDGLEIIRRLKEVGFSQFVLATAEYWKPAIKESAKQLGITLCPKPLPKVVVKSCHSESKTKDLRVDSSAAPQNDNSTHQNKKQGPSVLLIDDDEGIRLTWGAIQKTLGIATLHAFPNLEAVIQAKVNFKDCDLCVVDKNIAGSQYDGAHTLNYLKQNGAPKVMIASGERSADIQNDPQFAAMDGIITEKVPMSLAKYLSLTPKILK
jgi:signal transduction histidine kinase/CheY-like chemotaxis protein